MSKKVLIVSDGYGISSYHRPFKEFGDSTSDSDLLWTNPRSIALVVFTGGADISPSLYGQEAAMGTGCVPRRDIYETIAFHRARSLGLPMTGICRGAQLLNVMAGGQLCQHLEGHGYGHDMTTCEGKIFDVSSTHHQMMLPPEGSKVVAWATKRRSHRYLTEGNKELKPTPEQEYEVVYWPNIRAVGMQYHPEIMSEQSRGFRYAAELVKEYVM